MGKNTKRFALATIFAVIAGYVMGILTAPKSGKETRADIKDAADKTYAEAEKHLKKLHTELNQTIAEAKVELDSLKGKARDELENAANVAQKAKDKAREMLGAAHEGEAADKDLQIAIKEAADSLNHLKDYLKK
jgi:gas vesicle protein